MLGNQNTASFDKNGFVPWERCAQFSRKRSQSPKKRKPESGPPMDDNINLTIELNESCTRKKRRFQDPVSRHEIDMGESPASSAYTSPASLPDLDRQASSKFNNSEEPGDTLLTISSPRLLET
jgi:hypothetical protein